MTNEIKPMNEWETIPKSAVKLKKMTKEMTWEVKVVAGEEHLLDGLMQTAVNIHNALNDIYYPVDLKHDLTKRAIEKKHSPASAEVQSFQDANRYSEENKQ